LGFMPRFFAEDINFDNGVCTLSEEDAAHIRVLRMKPGERLIICGGGKDHICRIESVSPSRVRAELLETKPSETEPNIGVTLLCALPKGERADYIVQKCTEGGGAEIIFFPSARCIAKPDENTPRKKLPRWQKIAREAAQQSGRGVIPRISLLNSFELAVNRCKEADLALMMYEEGDGRVPLKTALSGLSGGSAAATAAIITGPEGGFEPYEAQAAKDAGITLCSMGSRIFRCETAPLAALIAVMYETGNL